MGCCSTRIYKIQIEQELVNLEQNLFFSSRSAQEIINVVTKNSSGTKISESQMKSICKSLNILDDQEANSYLHLLYKKEANCYLLQQIVTVGILYGQGLKSEKFTLLFHNYDIDKSGYLESNEIKKMILDITNISFHSLFEFFYNKNRTEVLSNFKDYQDDLIKIRNTMIKFVSNLIIGNDLGVSMTKFNEVVNKEEIQFLVNPHELRVASKKIYNLVMSEKALRKKCLIAQAQIDNKVMEKFSKRLLNPRTDIF